MFLEIWNVKQHVYEDVDTMRITGRLLPNNDRSG